MTTGPARCLYALRPADRPGCQLTATVAYRTTCLCTPCNERRSTLGKGQAGRQLPAVDLDPLDLLVDAYTQLTTATERLTSAVTRARQHDATWAAIARVLGTTRQAAQQRFTRP
jgi:hypothetical protein